MFRSQVLATWQLWLGIIGVAIYAHLFGRIFVDGLKNAWKDVHGWREYLFALGISLMLFYTAWLFLNLSFNILSWRDGWLESLPAYVVLVGALIFGPRLRRRLRQMHDKASANDNPHD